MNIILLLLIPFSLFAQKKIIVVHAYSNSEGKVLLLEKRSKGYYVKGKYTCRFGYNGISKTSLKDGKTPLGHYKINEKRKKSMSSYEEKAKFGGYFLQIDYPNSCDKRNKKTGGAIGLHGGANRNTEGCIRILDGNGKSINYSSIKKVADFATVGTDVIIVDIYFNSLLTESGYISKSATVFWDKLLSNRNCYHTIIGDMKSFQKFPNENGINIGVIYDSDGWTNIRASKLASSKIIGKIHENEAFTYIKYSGDWYYLSKRNGLQGYIHKSRVVELLNNYSGIAVIADRDGWTNVRAHPSNDAQIISKVYENEFFWYKKIPGDWWSIVQEDGTKGYMHSSRIKSIIRR